MRDVEEASASLSLFGLRVWPPDITGCDLCDGPPGGRRQPVCLWLPFHSPFLLSVLFGRRLCWWLRHRGRALRLAVVAYCFLVFFHRYVLLRLGYAVDDLLAAI